MGNKNKGKNKNNQQQAPAQSEQGAPVVNEQESSSSEATGSAEDNQQPTLQDSIRALGAEFYTHIKHVNPRGAADCVKEAKALIAKCGADAQSLFPEGHDFENDQFGAALLKDDSEEETESAPESNTENEAPVDNTDESNEEQAIVTEASNEKESDAPKEDEEEIEVISKVNMIISPKLKLVVGEKVSLPASEYKRLSKDERQAKEGKLFEKVK